MWRKVIRRKKYSVAETDVWKQYFPGVPLAAPQCVAERKAVAGQAVFMPKPSLSF